MRGESLQVYWAVAAVAIALAFFVLGRAIRGDWFGILFDDRNKMSLSRLQILLWTILLLSAFAAIALAKTTTAIYFGPELWALMAISTGSVAGAVVIKDQKAQQGTLASNIVPAAVVAPGPPAAPVVLPAKFSDMFKGDSTTSEAFVDVSKVQMFFFTVAAIFGYVVALLSCDLAMQPADVQTYDAYFPTLSASLVTLIGISHAGYLTVKAAS